MVVNKYDNLAFSQAPLVFIDPGRLFLFRINSLMEVIMLLAIVGASVLALVFVQLGVAVATVFFLSLALKVLLILALLAAIWLLWNRYYRRRKSNDYYS